MGWSAEAGGGGGVAFLPVPQIVEHIVEVIVRLWSGSRNSPALHRQRGGHSCRQQTRVFAVPRTPFIDKVMDIPVVRGRLVHRWKLCRKLKVPQFVVDVVVIMQRQVHC